MAKQNNFSGKEKAHIFKQTETLTPLAIKL